MDGAAHQPICDAPSRAIIEWSTILRQIEPSLRLEISHLIREHAEHCAETFYTALLDDEAASAFLSTQIVRDQLAHALKMWLTALFSLHPPDPAALIALQKRVGTVHARIRVPMRLVLHGARILKDMLRPLLFEKFPLQTELLAVVQHVDNMIDMAMEIMGGEFVEDFRKEIATDEACRLVTLGQDLAVEKEAQRAALLDWGHKILLAICCAHPPPLPTLEKSGFGLWLVHKGTPLFGKMSDFSKVHELIDQLDHHLLPRIEKLFPVPPGEIQNLQEIQQEIGFLLNNMFTENELIAGGRDPLTSTLSRRFLPSILSREVTLALRNNLPLTVLLVDIDHFRLINDRFGHAQGDSILRSVSEIISGLCRPGDFVFRHGGEEFLVVLVETDEREASSVAEHIRSEVFHKPLMGTTKVTVSIGLATFDGHPDYEHLIHEADAALAQAKQEGRNRCIMNAERTRT
ncbi:GGDEF domain-containing protein [Acetobacter estunensis]|uniref:GGDEF domain-containing protein n=1 Tax=Acetobacter estunensis TaxID=104097 RepID=UPI0034A01F23